MDIYKYKEDVLKKLEDISDEEFVDVLKKAGVNCKLTKNETYKLGRQRKTKFYNYYSFNKNNYINKAKKYKKTIATYSHKEKVQTKEYFMKKIKYNYNTTNNNFNDWSEVAA